MLSVWAIGPEGDRDREGVYTLAVFRALFLPLLSIRKGISTCLEVSAAVDIGFSKTETIGKKQYLEVSGFEELDRALRGLFCTIFWN